VEQDRASALLGVDVEVEDGGRLSVWVATDDVAAAVCPGCGLPAGRVHERVVTRPADVRRGADPVVLVWAQTPMEVPEPGMPTGDVPRVAAADTGQAAADESASGSPRAPGRSARYAGLGRDRRVGVSWPTVHEAPSCSASGNAKSEGLNRTIKPEGRKAYGFRNPTDQRRRLRCATTKRPSSRQKRALDQGSLMAPSKTPIHDAWLCHRHAAGCQPDMH
jgi:hypothetical protein